MRRVWDLGSGKCLRVLEGHSGRVNAVSVCDQSGAVLTASDDSTARVWDMETGRCVAVLEVRTPPAPTRVSTVQLDTILPICGCTCYANAG